jgi:hypothetical protein
MKPRSLVTRELWPKPAAAASRKTCQQLAWIDT